MTNTFLINEQFSLGL